MEVNVRKILRESIKQILIESQESKSIDEAKKLVMQKLGYDRNQADEFIRIKLRNDLPVLRDKNAAKFILGATRMFLDGQIQDAQTISSLNTTLKYVASEAHINEYDRNLNDMSAQDLIQRFAKNVEMDMENDRNEVNAMQFDTPSDYEIVRIDSFEQASEYGSYTSWCVTHDNEMFDAYTSNGINQFYFCLKHGFENVEKNPTEGCPLDEYGLSMIAVCVNEKGMLNTCTCRWNHDEGGDDNIMNTKQISQVLGMNFYEIFKPNNKWNEMVENALQRLKNGEKPWEVFDEYYEQGNGFAGIELNRKMNFIDTEGNLLSPNQWFDSVGCFHCGFAVIELNGKCNYISTHGTLIRGDFQSFDQWFDNGCLDFRDNIARIKNKGKWNFIDTEGNILFPDKKFDYCTEFNNGFAGIEVNGKYNFIEPNGNLLSPNQWFDWCGLFSDGFAEVQIDEKENFISSEGNILSPDQWFDECRPFSDGIAIVKLDGKCNFIDTEGNLLSPNQWFDSCSSLWRGFATVKFNGKTYHMDKLGWLYDPETEQFLCVNVRNMNTQNESLSKPYKKIISETKHKLLRESKRDDFLNQYLPLLQKRGIETNLGQLKSFLLKKFADEFGIHSLSKGSNFYLAGVTRYYFEGLLTTNKRLNVLYSNVKDKPITELCTDLDILIDILRNAYIDSVGTKYEQPEDFGTLPLDKLLKKYNKKIKKVKEDLISTQNIEAQKNNGDVDTSTNAGKDYTYQIIYNQEEVRKFERYTSPGAWCITYNKAFYNDYVRKLDIHYIVFMRKGFESVPRKVGKGFTRQKPHDEYGNSLICVLQSNKSPEPIYITSRWNHGSGETAGTEADHAYTKEEFLNVIGCDGSIFNRCFEQWKANGGGQSAKEDKKKYKAYILNATRYIKYAQMMISNGARLQDFFNDVEVILGNPEKPNKSVAIVGFENNDFPTKVYTLYDRGVLQYDNFLYPDGTKPRGIKMSDTLIRFEYDNRYKFYNTKRHAFLDINNTIEFKTFEEGEDDLSIVAIEVGASRRNEFGILNSIASEFLEAPNKAKYFTRVWSAFGSGYHSCFKISLDDILILDNFLYDVRNKKFLDVRPKIYFNNLYYNILPSYGPPNHRYVAYKPERYEYDNFVEIFLNVDTNEILNIDGYTEFYNTSSFCKDKIFAFLPLEKHIEFKGKIPSSIGSVLYYYDKEINKTIEINGKPLLAGYDYMREQGVGAEYLILKPLNFNNKKLIYNVINHALVSDNNGNPLLFDSVEKEFPTNNWRDAYLEAIGVDGKTYELHTSEKISNIKESVKKVFYSIFDKIK